MESLIQIQGSDKATPNGNQQMRRILDALRDAQAACGDFIADHGDTCECEYCATAIGNYTPSERADEVAFTHQTLKRLWAALENEVQFDDADVEEILNGVPRIVAARAMVER